MSCARRRIVSLFSWKRISFLHIIALMYLSIEAAACLPAPIAKMTVAAPVTASPPAHTPSFDVASVSSSTTIPPHEWHLRSGVVSRQQRVSRLPDGRQSLLSRLDVRTRIPAMATGPVGARTHQRSPIHGDTTFIPVTQPSSLPQHFYRRFERSLKIMPLPLLAWLYFLPV